MPIKQSAKKALRQSQKAKTRNLRIKRKLSGILKEMKSLVDQKKIKEVDSLLPQVYKILDKAAKKGILKENTASRKKSRLTKSIKA